eukprot:TRINITY_DN11761_c0_g1_i3.p1 TRINITY_DN11761_c0_g1~~TRINITY_DN11761_c0_g1_i3.p1  ORF type:complete len:136 (-),score=16.76 TRINITY_DN11761_c0_g1_i3:137-544(-)
MAGTCGLSLTMVHALIGDEQNLPALTPRKHPISVWSRWLLAPFEMMGMNAILIFFWHGTAEALICSFFIQKPVANSTPSVGNDMGPTLLGWLRDGLIGCVVVDHSQRQLMFVLMKVCCYMIATWICYRRKYFWKI